ncbi:MULTISPECIES: CGNR zinc finger domain-containing protein [unclassified Pseudoclavibacter]|uniref:CGNR zinc finger domain-containing protein n=1 Tax=unclassified Pseudoclavibacter TaxID=2615177 RepID=UPI001BA5D446|nr:CGNR zinc finger domain-containing protein [Pseudoclavibacter sp. Marseille-Q4354]MBS3180429.1 CGNR zinc finger domain-containing protein [Pseudoclavibacter sp. Marseille-Q4354]
MQFNHDNMTGALLAAELVNAEASNGPEARVGAALELHGIRGRAALSTFVDGVLEWARLLRRVFEGQDARTRCDEVNALLALGASKGVYLSTHDGLDPHLHFAPDSDDLLARVRAVTAGGLAIFLTESRGSRLGVCSRRGCEQVFVDVGRNATRRYCSTRCGNNDAVDRYRQRG